MDLKNLIFFNSTTMVKDLYHLDSYFDLSIFRIAKAIQELLVKNGSSKRLVLIYQELTKKLLKLLMLMC